MSYAKRVAKAAQSARENLGRNKVNVDDIVFGGAIKPPAAIRAPTFADSKFQAEQALGDWAEGSLALGMNAALKAYKAVHYGFSSKIVAGEPGFKEEYQRGVLDTCEWGKRADLLVLPKAVECDRDISGVETRKTKGLVAESLGCVEVRSSRTEALRYIAYQRKRLAAGERIANTVPNFTVKIEDLMKVFRWIEVFEKPQMYAQVFLDVVYGINVLEIFEYIAGTNKLRIEEPQRSRKVTIYVPVTQGHQFARVAEYPTFSVVDRLTANGRHDIYARPSGGKMEVNGNELLRILKGERQS